MKKPIESEYISQVAYTRALETYCLIVAAPALLEAAKLVLAWYEAEDDHSKADFYERLKMCRESEDALRAAIAKATCGEADNAFISASQSTHLWQKQIDDVRDYLADRGIK